MKSMTLAVFAAVVVFSTSTFAQFDEPGNFTVGGNLGVGTQTPAQPLHVSSTSTNSTRLRLQNSEGFGDFFSDNNGFGIIVGGAQRLVMLPAGQIGVNTGAPVGQLHIRQGGTGGTILTLENAEGACQIRSDNVSLILQANNVTGAIVDSSGNMTVTNNMSSGIVEIRGAGNDLAEGFKIRETGIEAKPGMVVSICSEPGHLGELELSSAPYQSTVAGVISGAGDRHVGIQLGNSEEVANGELTPVALSGQVWCYVDASYGAVRPGDLLTTSPTVGHAMQATDPARSHGATIGKAMSSLDEGTGLVLVLVNLH